MSATKAEVEEAVADLREMLKPGTEVFTLVKHVSRSGMQREIALYVAAIEGGEPTIRDITFKVGRVLDYPMNRDRWALKVRGAGMDMCFAVVYHLSGKLFDDGYALKKRDL